MRLPTFSAHCTRKRTLCPGVVELQFERPAGFQFKAGQFVLFLVPAIGSAADTQVRAYSLASAPGDEGLLFVVKLVPGGRASTWIERVLAVGDMVTLQGPMGAFTVDAQTPKSYLFVATGTGIAPFRSLLRWLLLERREERRIDLLLGVRHSADLFWAEEMQALEASFPHFRAHVSFLSGGADWHGEEGTLQERMAALCQAQPRSVSICGAPQTVQSLRQFCLTALAVPPSDVHVESYV